MIKIPKENTNQCYKIINGEKRYKKKLKTDIDAINEAKRLNSKPNAIHKVVAYKCSLCLYYHVGRSFKLLKDKENT